MFSLFKYVELSCHKVEVKCIYSELVYPTIKLAYKNVQPNSFYSEFVHLRAAQNALHKS